MLSGQALLYFKAEIAESILREAGPYADKSSFASSPAKISFLVLGSTLPALSASNATFLRMGESVISSSLDSRSYAELLDSIWARKGLSSHSAVFSK